MQIFENFESSDKFFFKFCITLQCHDTQFLSTILAEILCNFKKGAYPSTNLVKFHGSSQKCEILHFDELLLSKSYKFSVKKSTKQLNLMTLKSDAKFKEKLTCGFKYDMRNLVIFLLTTQKFENFKLMGYFFPKYKWFELKK